MAQEWERDGEYLNVIQTNILIDQLEEWKHGHSETVTHIEI
jgi:hypothetical protein